MYKKDGTLFIGQFLNGKAQGKGALIFPNGNYFKGAFKNNRANCENG